MAPGAFPSSSLPIAPPLPTKKSAKQLLKEGQSQEGTANANAGFGPSPGPGATANDSTQLNPLNLTPKQQAAIAKKAAKLLLREQLKAAGVPFPDDPTSTTTTGM